jgi:DNA gyrase/topoisomerase IV subunit B
MANKNIQVLSDFEHILKRPTIYVGSVKISEEMIPIVRENMVSLTPQNISVGMYKLFDEVFSNCVDEAKRMKKPMEKITIHVDSKKNSISIEDSGEGFNNASTINTKSGLSNVATAVSMLRAGSNFDNENVSETLIGTNGMGVSLVNALSSYFSIQTTNSSETYFQEWNKFVPSNEVIKKRNRAPMGTKVSFVPLEDIFEKCKWSKEILRSMLILKKRVLETEAHTKPTKLILVWDGKEEEINTSILKHISYKTPISLSLIELIISTLP